MSSACRSGQRRCAAFKRDYRWNTQLVAHHFCPACGRGTFTDSPAFEADGSWDKRTRRIGVNARLFDNFVAADAPVAVIDGKNLW